MRLIGKPRNGCDGGQRCVASGDQREGAAGPNLLAEGRRCDAKHFAEAARNGFGGKTMLFCPGVEAAIGIIPKIASKNIRPIFRGTIGLKNLFAQLGTGFHRIAFAGAYNGIRIANVTDAEIRCGPGNHKVEYLRASVLKAIQMRVKCPMQKDVAGADAEAPVIAAFLVATGKNDRGVGLRVAMTRNAVLRAPIFRAISDLYEACHSP